jgi:hypothetical protein
VPEYERETLQRAKEARCLELRRIAELSTPVVLADTCPHGRDVGDEPALGDRPSGGGEKI